MPKQNKEPTFVIWFCIRQVEKVRHLLLLREKLGIDRNPLPLHQDISKSEKEACNIVAKATADGRKVVNGMRPIIQPKDDVYEPWDMTDRERELTTKCVKLIQGHINMKEPPAASPCEDDSGLLMTSFQSSMMTSSSPEYVLNSLMGKMNFCY